MIEAVAKLVTIIIVLASIGAVLDALAMKEARKRALIEDGTCKATGATQVVDRGTMSCAAWGGQNNNCLLWQHSPRLVREAEYQCSTGEAFWR